MLFKLVAPVHGWVGFLVYGFFDVLCVNLAACGCCCVRGFSGYSCLYVEFGLLVLV